MATKSSTTFLGVKVTFATCMAKIVWLTIKATAPSLHHDLQFYPCTWGALPSRFRLIIGVPKVWKSQHLISKLKSMKYFENLLCYFGMIFICICQQLSSLNDLLIMILQKKFQRMICQNNLWSWFYTKCFPASDLPKFSANCFAFPFLIPRQHEEGRRN